MFNVVEYLSPIVAARAGTKVDQQQTQDGFEAHTPRRKVRVGERPGRDVHVWLTRLAAAGGMPVPGRSLTRPVIDACRARGVRFSITVRLNPGLRTAIAGIDESAWTPIPAEQWARNDGAAHVAETRLPGAFAGDDEPVRLVVRRVNPKAAKPGEDPQLLPDWRYHAFVTDRFGGTTLETDRWHRRHAQVENAIRDLKHHGGLAHLPSGVFAANAAWLTLVAIAHNLGRHTLLLGKGIDCWSSTKTLRCKLLAWPARTARHARGITLHGPADRPTMN